MKPKFKEKFLYNKNKINFNDLLFDNKALIVLLVPIVIEQLLNSFMGLADTVMVSSVGQEAITAVSLVDSINILIIQVFSAMAAGAAIICSQYIGAGKRDMCNKAAKQVVFTVFLLSMFITFVGMVFYKPVLTLTFGKIESSVMQKCRIYFLITVMSYPFLALFNCGAAFFRAGGNSRFPMIISLISNVINVVGNAVMIYIFKMGVVGAALSTLISRIFCMVVIFIALRKDRQIIVVKDYLRIRPDMKLIKKIVYVGLPSGVESGMFQFGKLAIQSTISILPTAALAAQAMTNVFENVNGVFGVAIGIGLMTAVGQCIGAGRTEEAKYYIVKFTLIAEIGLSLSCIFAYAIAGPVTTISGMSPESKTLCMSMLAAITIVKPLVWTLSFVPAYGFRAAGDVKFSMIVAVSTMWTCRVALCVVLVKFTDLGTMSVWFGMFADWTIRAIIFTIRFISGKWLKNQVLTR